MDAMILSAGLGIRMRPLTESTPKALLKAGSRRLIEYHLINLAKAGISNVVINTSYIADMFEQALGTGDDHGVRITFSHEGAMPLETGGGIRKALPLIRSDPFLIVNADVWTDFCFGDARIEDHYDGSLIVVDNPSHHPEGDFTLIDDRLILPDRRTGTVTYSGIAVLRKCLLEDSQSEIFPLYQVFRNAISLGRLAGHHHSGDWIDVGTPERLEWLDIALGAGESV